MRLFACILTTLFLVACVAPGPNPHNGPHHGPNYPGHQGHPPQGHLPPPDFPVSPTPPPNARYCGGMVVRQGAECRVGEFCRRTIGDLCGAADAPGVCSPIPQMCTQQYAPVCGCDGQTYSNECVANGQGVSASYAGECR